MKTAIMLGKQICPTINILKSGLLAIWGFNELLGVTALDSYLNNYDLTKSGSYTNNQTGVSNDLTPCILLDGTTGYAYLDDGSVIAPINNHSISIWIKQTSTPIGSSVLVTRIEGGATVYDLQLSDSGLGTSSLSYTYTMPNNSRAGVVTGSPSSIWLNNWKHIVASRAGDFINIYIDSVLAASSNVGTGISIVRDTLKDRVGAYGASFGTFDTEKHFEGYIDQTAVWNRGLTQDDVCNLYNFGKGLPYTDWLAGG